MVATLALLHEHFAKDDLVAWGGRRAKGASPRQSKQLGELVQAWIESGAQCKP